MPHHVKQEIVNSADTLIKHSLRQCSKEYKSLVDNSKMCYKSLSFEGPSIHITNNPLAEDWEYCMYVRMVINDENGFHLRFDERDNGFLRTRSRMNTEKLFENGNYIDGALEQFEKLLRKRNAHWENLEINFHGASRNQQAYDENKEYCLRKIRGILSSLNYKIPVEEFSLNFAGSSTDVLNVLPYLEPETLKVIRLSNCASPNVMELCFNEISETEQYKQAKTLRLFGYQFAEPYDKWSHFSNIEFEAQEFPLSLQQHLFHKYMADSKFECFRVGCKNLDHRQTLEYFFQYNPEIYTRTKTYTLSIEVPDRPDLWFRILITRTSMIFYKVRKDDKEILPDHALEMMRLVGLTDEIVKLEAADVLANIYKYF